MIALICWVREYIVRHMMRLQGMFAGRTSQPTKRGTIKVNAFFLRCRLGGTGSGEQLRHPNMELSPVWVPPKRRVNMHAALWALAFLKPLPYREHKALMHFLQIPIFVEWNRICVIVPIWGVGREMPYLFSCSQGKGCFTQTVQGLPYARSFLGTTLLLRSTVECFLFSVGAAAEARAIGYLSFLLVLCSSH